MPEAKAFVGKAAFAATLKEARIGVPEAQYQVGLMYANGAGVKKDIPQAVHWIKKAAERGLLSAQYLLGTRYESGIGVEPDAHLAAVWYTRAAGQGSPKATFRLGKIYANSHTETSRRLIEEAAKDGLAEAQFSMGQLLTAKEVGQDQAGLDWLQRAADQGFAPAQHALGDIFSKGLLVKRDLDAACDWYRLAARQNFPAAQLALEAIDAGGAARSRGKGRSRKRSLADERRLAGERWARVAEGGDADAKYHIGLMYEMGLGLAQDVDKAQALYRAAARAGDSRSQAALGRLLEEQDLTEALYWYRKASSQGQTDAQYALGRIGLSGLSGAEDALTALVECSRAANAGHPEALMAIVNLGTAKLQRLKDACLQRAADLGMPQAQLMLARQLSSNRPPDDIAAFSWSLKSAKRGLAEAQVAVAIAYLNGRGVLADLLQATEWFHRAAEQGDPCAQWNLGAIYASGGIGVPADLKQAFEWCSLSAEQGFVAAQASLGIMYARMGAHQKAVAWWRRAAEQGDAESQFNLAQALTKGEGAKVDPAEAFAYFAMSAEAGLVDAQLRLAVLYASGDGAILDLVEACKWFHIASRSGDKVAMQNLAKAMGLLSEAQYQEGTRRGELWLANRQTNVKNASKL